MARKRLLLPNFITPELCKELIFIQKSCGVVGYRPHVFSTTLSHLVATNCAALLMPFIALREKVKEAVEEYFACEFELFVEFTGLISWTKGADIGWHSDNNRKYLQQRHFSAVCYLNTYEHDFRGGLFHFQDGEPATVVPTMGTVLIYSANEDNVHCVDEVTEGERFTMALWFTRDHTHDEDTKLIKQLCNRMPRSPDDDPAAQIQLVHVDGYGDSPPSETHNFIPLAASTNMYWVDDEGEREFSHDAKRKNGARDAVVAGGPPERNPGYDIRAARLASLGFQFAGHDVKGNEVGCRRRHDSQGVLDTPLKLVFRQQEISYTFANSLHALQAVQFHDWRGDHSTRMSKRRKTPSIAAPQAPGDETVPDRAQPDDATTLFVHNGLKRGSDLRDFRPTDWDGMDGMVKAWEEYMATLWRDMSRSLSAWQASGSLFVSHDEGT